MIEAVNAVVSNSSLLRSSTDQVDVSRAIVTDDAEPINVPRAPYISPYIAVDIDNNKAVLQIRDSDTGDVLRQFPSETRLRQLQNDARAAERAQSSSSAGSGGVSVDATAVENVASASSSLASSGGSVTSAQAQAASVALSSSAQAASASLSAGVSVVA